MKRTELAALAVIALLHASGAVNATSGTSADAGTNPTAAAAEKEMAPRPSLCDLLSSAGPGDGLEVEIEGRYVVSHEFSFLYDPQSPLCPWDVQPSTSVEFSSAAKRPDRLEEILRADRRAHVVFNGRLLGPAPPSADDLTLPVMLSYANRIAGRRYGHMGAFRTKLIVEQVVEFSPVPADVPSYGEVSRSRPVGPTPMIRSGVLPTYPEAAQRAGIEGEVVLEVQIEDGEVTSVVSRKGDRLLAQAAIETARSWHFERGVNTMLSSEFIFLLEIRPTGADRNTRYTLHLPARAVITGAANMW